jgi:NitT/TauT family transport system substrate-binding protein
MTSDISRRGFTSLGLLASALALVPAPARSEDMKKLIVQNGAAAPALDTARLDIAKSLGFFSQEGLDVQIRYGAGAGLAAQLTANNQVDVSVITYEPIIIGHDKGLNGKIFYQTTSRVIYYIAVPEDGPVKAAVDLKGKKIGVVSLGSAATTVSKSILRSAGLTPGDATFLPAGFGDQAANALRSGQVDALALWDGGYASMVSSGMKLRFIRHPKLVDGGNAGLYASDQTIGQRADELRRFARAYTKATIFMKANPEAAIRIFWRANPGSRRAGDETEVLRRARVEFDFIAPTFDAPHGYGHVQEGLFEKYVEMLHQEGEVAAVPPVSAFVTRDLLTLSDQVDVAGIEALARQWREP